MWANLDGIMITLQELIENTEKRLAQDRKIMGLFESKTMQVIDNHVAIPHEVSAAICAESIAKDEELLTYLHKLKEQGF